MIRRTPPVRAASKAQSEAPRRAYRAPISPPASVEAYPIPLHPPAPHRREPRGWLAALIATAFPHHWRSHAAAVTVEPRWHPRALAAGSTAAARAPEAADIGTTDHAADQAGARDRLAASATMIVAAGLAVAVSFIVAPRLRDANMPANPATSPLLAQGAAVFSANCAGCHGVSLTGGAASGMTVAGIAPPPLDASGHAWLHSDTTLFRMIKFGIASCTGAAGETRMPNFADQLDDASIRAVIAFVKSRWPHDFQLVQNAFNDGESDTAESQEAVLCSAICQPPALGATASAAGR